MDPFEEFEFKPITDGLGFHKKKPGDASTTTDKSDSLSRDLLASTDLPSQVPVSLLEDREKLEPKTQAEAYNDLMKALSKPADNDLDLGTMSEEELELSQPLPRSSDKKMFTMEPEIEMNLPDMDPTAPILPERSRMPEILEDKPMMPGSSTFDRKRQAGVASSVRRGASNSPGPSALVEAPVSFSAALLDFVLVVALAGVFLVSLLLITKVELQSVFANAQRDLLTQLSIGILFVAVMQMYVVISRSFFGRTLGEWTFDFQMGKDEEILSATYPVRIVWRSLLTVLTGVVTLPILSFLLQKDITGILSGVKLYKQR